MAKKKPKGPTKDQNEFLDIVSKHQGPPTGQGMLVEVEGLLQPFYYDNDLFLGERISKRLKAEQGWFEKMVSHAPSVGTFYENALRALVAENLPSRYKVGTGFIFNPDQKSYSKQLDILVYDDQEAAPFFKRGDFVVIAPSMAIAQSEVKKTLRAIDLRKLIAATLFANYGNHPSEPPCCSRLCLFAYSSKLKTAKILEILKSSLLNMIQNLRRTSPDGRMFMAALTSIVLPRIYFFDRDRYFETKLEQSGDFTYRLEVGEYVAALGDCLNEYIHCMTESWGEGEINFTGIPERDFKTHPLRNI